jgi:predicted RND superfamily exporter protein
LRKYQHHQFHYLATGYYLTRWFVKRGNNMFSSKVANFCLRYRWQLMLSISLVTIVLATFAARIEIKTYFNDLLPTDHPYIEVNEQYKNTLGGANIVTLMVEVEQGDIFQLKVLNTVRELTRSLQYVDAVNQFQIISLASKKMKAFSASTEGIEARPMMWPELPKGQQQLDLLRQDVLSSPLVYGRFVSSDLKAALVTVDFLDNLIDYDKVYPQIQQLVEKHQRPGINIRIVGQPVLSGIVLQYLPETLAITAYIAAAVAFILLLASGNVRGVVLPLLAAVVSGAWAMGISQLLGINLDPLGIVIAFLVAARAISHAVQINLAFDKEKKDGKVSSKEAARLALERLFRPGALGIITDAGGILVVTLAPMPLLQKSAVMGAVWVGSMLICNMIMNPLLLSWLKAKPQKKHFDFGLNRAMDGLLQLSGSVSTNKISASLMLVICSGVLLLCINSALNLTIGDAKPGSPLLWPDHRYNQDDAAIGQRFPGNDRMYVVVEGHQKDALKQPEVLNNISSFQQYIEALPQVGSTTSVADIIRPINMLLNEDNPRFYKIGNDNLANAEMLYLALASSDPGDVDRFTDMQFQNGAVQMTIVDHQGDTIRTVIEAIKQYAEANPIAGADYVLAGGFIGVLAAVNEEIFSGQAQSIALALLVLFICCALAYRSAQAGMFFLPLVLLSNTITFAFMSVNGIGLNVSTLPVAALGIGLGVDFAFYIVDSIKERLAVNNDLAKCIRETMISTGRGIIITALTMFASVVFWYFFSSLRLQAEMGLLIALWMSVSAFSALFVIPSMIYLFRPSFVLRSSQTNELNLDAPYQIDPLISRS